MAASKSTKSAQPSKVEKKVAKAVKAKVEGCAQCARALLSGGRCAAHGDPKKTVANKAEAAAKAPAKFIDVSSPKANPAPTKKAKVAAEKKDFEDAGKRAAFRAQVITLLVKENPRREGTELHRGFAMLKTGITVGEWLEKSGASMGSVHKCAAKGWISLAAPK